jgi:hypothetical protein
MTELSTAGSFIVRIYRFDTEDRKKLTGLVEAMEESGAGGERELNQRWKYFNGLP